MALVKVLVANLFAGASLQKLEAGQVYDVDDSIAEKWIEQGKVEKSTEKKGEKLIFEVATPSAPVASAASDLQSKLNDALEQLKQAQSDADAKDKEHADALEQLKQAHATELESANKRADEAEAALAEAIKKAK
jgi:NAD-specific glutamate dehydrogenase